MDGLGWRIVVAVALLVAGFTLQAAAGRQQAVTPDTCRAGAWTDECQYAAEQAYRLEGVAMSMQWEYLTGHRWD